MPSDNAVFGQFADELEAELRRLGAWGSPPPVGEVTTAFGQPDLAFTQWLEHVLCVRLREVAAGEWAGPNHSEVAAQAVRELDGWDGAAPLLDVLQRLDEFICSRAAG